MNEYEIWYETCIFVEAKNTKEALLAAIKEIKRRVEESSDSELLQNLEKLTTLDHKPIEDFKEVQQQLILDLD